MVDVLDLQIRPVVSEAYVMIQIIYHSQVILFAVRSVMSEFRVKSALQTKQHQILCVLRGHQSLQ